MKKLSGNQILILLILLFLSFLPEFFLITNKEKYWPSKAKIEYKDKIKVVYKINMNDEMILLAKYIRHRQKKIPIEIINYVAYEIVKQSREENLPWQLVAAIVERESFFYPSAISPADAKGLTQILRAHKIKIDQNRA